MKESKNATEAYKALKKQFSDAASKKAEFAAQQAARIAETDDEISRLERKLNTNTMSMGYEEFQKASEALNAAFNKRELLEKQQKEFQKIPLVGKAEYQEFKKALTEERKATEAAAEAEIYKLLCPLTAAAEKYTTILNELRSLEYVYRGCFGKENGDVLAGFGFEPYFPDLLNGLNLLLSSAFNQYAKDNGKTLAAICDTSELSSERQEILHLGNMLGFGSLPETRFIERHS